MTAFLASVQSLEEARMVLEQGADVIDLKRPATGALGAVSSELAAEITRFVGGRRTVSATIGDLPCAPDVLAPAVKRMLAAGVDIVKVGVFEPQPPMKWWFELRRLCAQGWRIIVVLFADRAPDLRLLQRGAETGLYGVMLDTATKEGGCLRDWLEDTQIEAFIRRAQSLGLCTGLAGSLGVDDIDPLLCLKPDYLGFRGALCHRRDRIAALDACLVSRVRRQIPQGCDAVFSLQTLAASN
ncbi:MAG: (5-formylfuran-3-yl)methyl phosphate synthase [Gammaproteobacteria bacterium]